MTLAANLIITKMITNFETNKVYGIGVHYIFANYWKNLYRECIIKDEYAIPAIATIFELEDSYLLAPSLGITKLKELLPVPPTIYGLNEILSVETKPPIPNGPYNVLCPANAIKSIFDISTLSKPKDWAVSIIVIASTFLAISKIEFIGNIYPVTLLT